MPCTLKKTSLLSIMFVEDKSKRVRMWRPRCIQIHGKSIRLWKIIAAFRQPCSTYLSFSAAYSGSEDEVEAPRFNTRKNAKWDVQRVYMRMNTHKPKQLQVFQQISCELALYGFHTRDDIGEYIMIAFLQCRSATEVKTTGASLIHKWAP